MPSMPVTTLSVVRPRHQMFGGVSGLELDDESKRFVRTRVENRIVI